MKLTTLMKRHDAAIAKYESWWSCYCNCHLDSGLQTYRMNLLQRINMYKSKIREAMKTDTTPVPQRYLDFYQY